MFLGQVMSECLRPPAPWISRKWGCKHRVIRGWSKVWRRQFELQASVTGPLDLLVHWRRVDLFTSYYSVYLFVFLVFINLLTNTLPLSVIVCLNAPFHCAVVLGSDYTHNYSRASFIRVPRPLWWYFGNLASPDVLLDVPFLGIWRKQEDPGRWQGCTGLEACCCREYGYVIYPAQCHPFLLRMTDIMYIFSWRYCRVHR